MLGILDTWYVRKKLKLGYIEVESDWKPEIHTIGNKKIAWICFVPGNISKKRQILRGVIPKEGEVFVYTISSSDLIVPSTEETVAKLEVIYRDALHKMTILIQHGYEICLLGVSLGNVLSIRLAGETQVRITKLVSIVGGCNLGLSGWDSILTENIARRSGCRSAEEYENQLSAFSPGTYIDKIDADTVLIRLGACDRLIHFRHGKALLRAFSKRSKETNMKIDSKVYWLADHGGAMILSALENPCEL